MAPAVLAMRMPAAPMNSAVARATPKHAPLEDALGGHAVAYQALGQLIGHAPHRALHQARGAGRANVGLAQVEPGVARVLCSRHICLHLRSRAQQSGAGQLCSRPAHAAFRLCCLRLQMQPTSRPCGNARCVRVHTAQPYHSIASPHIRPAQAIQHTSRSPQPTWSATASQQLRASANSPQQLPAIHGMQRLKKRLTESSSPARSGPGSPRSAA